MGKIPNELRETIARNMRDCRMKKYPGRGGGKKCAEEFGVSPQQWSPWERGVRTPDELRLSQIGDFFGVTVEYLRRDNTFIKRPESEENPEPQPNNSEGSFNFILPHVAYPSGKTHRRCHNNQDTVYVPVFVLLPHLPEDMQVLYDQFHETMNKKKIPGKPFA